MEGVNNQPAALATWVYLVPLLAIAFALIVSKGRSMCARSRSTSQVGHASTVQITTSRFLPGVFAGAIGCFLLLAAAVLVIRFSMARQAAPATLEDARPFAVAIQENDIEQLLAQVREQSSDTIPEPIPVTVPRETEENLPPAEPDLPPLLSTDPQPEDTSLNVTLFAPYATEGTPAAELPEWTSQTGTTDGLPQVVTTGPNPRRIGAMADAFSRLSRLVSEEFAQKHPEAAGWIPQFSDLYRVGLIGRRAVLQSEITVGQFTEPVFREFIEVVPPADLDARLFKLWRAETAKSRLLLVGCGMGLLTLLFGSVAGYYRIDEATRGKYRRQLRAGTGAVWLAAAGGAMLIAESLVG